METVLKNLAKESKRSMDNYFSSWDVLVYFEETVWWGTEGGRYYVVKITLNNYELILK